jgi:hypothetical protein
MGFIPPEPVSRKVRTGGVEPPQRVAAGYSPLSPPMLGVRVKGRPTGFEPVPRGSPPRMLPLHHSHHDGDDRTRTGGLSPDKRALWPLSYAPQRLRGWDSNPRLELMGLARKAAPPPRVVSCKSGRLESNQRSPVPETGGVADSPTARRSVGSPGIEPALPVISEPCRHGHRPPSSGGRARTCSSRLTVARRTRSTTPE